MTTTKIFDKSHLKVSPDMQDEIIHRFNDYDLLVRVMKLAEENIKTTVKTSPDMNHTDKVDLWKIANLLQDATTREWQKENVLYY